MPPGCRLPRHAHNTHRMEIVVRGSIITPDGEELRPGDVSLSGPGEFYGPLFAGSEGCLTIEIFSGINGLAPVPDEDDDKADRTAPMLRKARSEEHTSELQSLTRISYAAFCLK